MKLFAFLFCLLFLPLLALASDAPNDNVTNVEIQTNYWAFVIPFLTPVIIALVAKKVFPLIPGWAIVSLTPMLGVGLDFINAMATTTGANPGIAALLGLAGVGVRELLDQIKKSGNAPAVVRASVFLAALILPFSGTGCVRNAETRPLAPDGIYAGQSILWQYDGLIKELSQTFDKITDLADRNPSVIAGNERLAEAVTRIRAEQDGTPDESETLTKLLLARNAYIAARSAETEDALQTQIGKARTFLETARALLPLFVSGN